MESASKVSRIKQIENQQAHANLLEALSAAQAELIGAIVKDGTNKEANSRYPTLDGVLCVVVPVLHRHGLLLMQPVRSCFESRMVVVTTTIIHVATGERIEEPFELISPAYMTMRVLGALITYIRRYTLMPLIGLASVDDDGDMLKQVQLETEAKSADRPSPSTGTTSQQSSAQVAQSRPAASPAAQPSARAEPSTEDKIRERLKSTPLSELGAAESFIKGRADLTDEVKDDLLKLCLVRRQELETAEGKAAASASE